MSVGVCIINGNGIALAADSAGTINYASTNKMFYNSMNKVFNLSNKNMLGAITYGGTTVHNVSIEAILKKFKEHIDNRDESIDDIFNIVKIFEQFLSLNKVYFMFDKSENVVCESLISSLVKEWGGKINDCFNSYTEEEIKEKIESVLDQFNDTINNALKISGYDNKEYIRKNYNTLTTTLIKSTCPKFMHYEEYLNIFLENIYEYFNLSLTNETINNVGLLFAGFDNKSIFAKFIHINILNFIGEKLKYTMINSGEAHGNYAVIVPLAQPEVMRTFYYEISEKYLDSIPGLIASEIDKKMNELKTSIPEDVFNQIKIKLGNIGLNVKSSIMKKSREESFEPFINNIVNLRVPELAFLSESLVNITSLKRQYSIDGFQQTVGGPTDVATICQGEGFIWIKRKHYFDKDKNIQYLNKIKI